jgi:hypothetical protein
LSKLIAARNVPEGAISDLAAETMGAIDGSYR